MYVTSMDMDSESIPDSLPEKKSLSPVTSQPRALSKQTPIAKVSRFASFDHICERKWSTPVYACLSDKKQCCLGTFCWPCMKCRLADRMGEFPVLGCLVPGGLTSMRVKIRIIFGIKGSICNDCLVTTLCEPCAICQMVRELDKAGL